MGKKKSGQSDFLERRLEELAESPHFDLGTLEAKHPELALNLKNISDKFSRNPDLKTGALVRAGARKGGDARRGELNSDTLEIIDYVNAGHSHGETAKKFKHSRDAIAKRVQYHRAKGVKPK